MEKTNDKLSEFELIIRVSRDGRVEVCERVRLCPGCGGQHDVEVHYGAAALKVMALYADDLERHYLAVATDGGSA